MLKLNLKWSIFFTALILCFFVFTNNFAYANGGNDKATFLSEKTVTRGAVLQEFQVQTVKGITRIQLTKINLKDPYIKIDALYGINEKLGKNQSVAKMAAEKGAIAAINGDFFDMTSGSLFGPIMYGGEWVTTPTMSLEGLSGFGITSGGEPQILPFSFQGSIQAANGQTFPVSSINKTYTLGNKVNVFTDKWDVNFLPGENLDSYLYLVVEKDNVQEILINAKPKRIPRDGYLIIGHGLGANFLAENIKTGDEITFRFQMDQGDDWQFVVGAHTPLVDKGQRAKFTRNIPGYHARTALGFSKDKNYLYWITAGIGEGSTGLTLEELADFMISQGIYQGVNLDGGGSTTLLARQPGESEATLITPASKGSLRSVPNGLGLYSTAPTGRLKDFIINAPNSLFINEKYILSLKAIDEFDNPLSVEIKNLSWMADNQYAQVQDNMLIGLKPGRATVKVEGEGISKAINIDIIGQDQIKEINLGQGPLLLAPGEEFSLKPMITNIQGVTREAPGTSFTWTWQGVSGSTKGEKLQAGQEPGKGWLIGSYDGFSATIPVQIGTTKTLLMNFENKPKLDFLGSPQEVIGDFVLTSDQVKDGNYSGALSYDFSQAVGDTQVAYGVFQPQDVNFSGVAKGMSLWVYGDAGGYWLRGEIVDDLGQINYITLADQVNWSGWRELKINFPDVIKRPVLKRIYLVKLKNSQKENQKEKGLIYLDQIAYETGDSQTTETKPVVIKLFVNEKRMLVNEQEKIIDQGPLVEKGRSYIPARFLIEALGGQVSWQAKDKQVRIILADNLIDLWVNKKDKVIVNGQNKPSDTAPIIRNSRTLVPVRLVTENLGFKVDWQAGKITVY